MWKDEERRIAKLFCGTRTGNLGSNTPDVTTDTLAIEVKERQSLPKWLWKAIDQARTNAQNRIPIVILHEKNRKRRLILMELDTLQRLLCPPIATTPSELSLPSANVRDVKPSVSPSSNAPSANTEPE